MSETKAFSYGTVTALVAAVVLSVMLTISLVRHEQQGPTKPPLITSAVVLAAGSFAIIVACYAALYHSHLGGPDFNVVRAAVAAVVLLGVFIAALCRL